MELLPAVFTVFKLIFGLASLGSLIAIGCMLLWFLLHVGVRRALHGQPADCCLRLRKLFLDQTT
jgi:hypothetical protein